MSTLVSGYAYSINESSEMHRRIELMKKLNAHAFKQYVTITASVPSYAEHKYAGVVDLENCPIQFTPEDLLIWLDGRPMAPFGGVIDYDAKSGQFTATVYTD